MELSKQLEDRPVGGLGIMLAKDGVDDLQYETTASGNIHRFIVRLIPSSDPVAPTQAFDEHRKLEVLLRISKSLGHQIELDPLLKAMVAEVTDAMQAERSTLFILGHGETPELVTRVAEGSPEIRIPLGVGIAGMAAEARRSINIPDAYKDSRFNPAIDRTSGFRTKALLTTPIVAEDNRLLGVVQVLNKKGGGAFTGQDEGFLEAICGVLNIALRRAEMVETHLQAKIVVKSLDLAREI